MGVSLALQLGLLALVIPVGILVIVYALRTSAPPVPTSARVREKLLAALPKKVDGMAVELGSGWGHLAVLLARRYPENAIFGYELSPLPWLVSNAWRSLAGLQNLWLHRRDFMDVPLGDVSLVVCYLDPACMRRLAAKFELELPLDAVIVSNTFALPGWTPVEQHRADDVYHSQIYVYRVGTSAPARRSALAASA